MNNEQIRGKLESIVQGRPNSIKAIVAQEALDYDDGENITCFFKDLAQGGCISGVVSSLIYYTDTAKFYDKHYHEIEDLREEYEAETGQPMKVEGQLKNWFAWFAFEQNAWALASEAGIDF